MILGASEVPSSVPTVLPDGNKGRPKQQQTKESPSSCLSLQLLVEVASTLFDETASREKDLAREQQKKESHPSDKEDPEPPKQPTSPPQKASKPPQHLNCNVEQICISPPACIAVDSLPTRIRSNSRHNVITHPTQIHCGTRQGFLSRLRSVLNDPSRSDVLSWMPDGTTFTIVSSRQFAKTGMVYELFGIRKMSSFLRRLNQLGFARVRDPTDPNNLDVFRKTGFVASHREAADATQSTTKAIQHLNSPTSTLQFASSMEDESVKGIPRNSLNIPSPGSSSVNLAPRTSCPFDLPPSTVSTTRTRSRSDCSYSSSASTPSSWVCSTPKIVDLSQAAQPSPIGNLPSVPPAVVVGAHKEPPLLPTSMSPAMPASSVGGPVFLRARSESYDSSSFSTPPSAIAAATPLEAPPNLIDLSSGKAGEKTPRVDNRRSVELSPGTLRNLELPILEHSTASSNSASVDTEIRPPPLEFVAECVRQLLDDHPSEVPTSTPMEVEPNEGNGESIQETHRTTPPTQSQPQRLRAQRFPKTQHQREYLCLYQAAEKEADAILSGSHTVCSDGPSSPSQTAAIRVETTRSPPQQAFPAESYEASVLADVNFLQGCKFKKVRNVSAE